MRIINVNANDVFGDFGNGTIAFNDTEGAGMCDFYEHESGIIEDGEHEGAEYTIAECHETGELVKIIWHW